MRYIDFIVQSLAFAAAIGILLYSMVDSKALIIILLIQLFLGIWQLISCGLSIYFKTAERKRKLKHLLISAIYLLLAGIGIAVGNAWRVPRIPRSATIALFVVLPWCIGIYYYIITISETFLKKKNHGSFLRHLSF